MYLGVLNVPKFLIFDTFKVIKNHELTQTKEFIQNKIYYKTDKNLQLDRSFQTSTTLINTTFTINKRQRRKSLTATSRQRKPVYKLYLIGIFMSCNFIKTFHHSHARTV